MSKWISVFEICNLVSSYPIEVNKIYTYSISCLPCSTDNGSQMVYLKIFANVNHCHWWNLLLTIRVLIDITFCVNSMLDLKRCLQPPHGRVGEFRNWRALWDLFYLFSDIFEGHCFSMDCSSPNDSNLNTFMH